MKRGRLDKDSRLRITLISALGVLALIVLIFGVSGKSTGEATKAFCIPGINCDPVPPYAGLVYLNECKDIDRPGVYILNKSVTLPPYRTVCFSIKTSNVIVYGKNNKIIGPGNLDTKDIQGIRIINLYTRSPKALSNITVTNVTIDGFGVGLSYYPTKNESLLNSKFTNNKIVNNLYGLYFYGGAYNNTISSNLINNNTIGFATSASYSLGRFSKNIVNSNTVCGNTQFDFSCQYLNPNFASFNKFTTRNNCAWVESNKRSC